MCALFVAACHLDMYDQPRLDAYQTSDATRNGVSQQPILPNVVSRDQVPGQADTTYSRLVGVQSTGTVSDTETTSNPLTVNDTVLSRGKERYGVYCVPCHGALGNGRGVVATQFKPGPPSFYIDRLVNQTDGHFFNIITNGQGLMYPYGSRISVDDRWAIVAYIRQLQATPPDGVRAPADFEEPTPVPEDQRSKNTIPYTPGDSPSAAPTATP